jgi:hypothetical protein
MSQKENRMDKRQMAYPCGFSGGHIGTRTRDLLRVKKRHINFHAFHESQKLHEIKRPIIGSTDTRRQEDLHNGALQSFKEREGRYGARK